MKNYLPFFIIVALLLAFGVLAVIFLLPKGNLETSLVREDGVNRNLNLEQQNSNQAKEKFDSQENSGAEQFKILYQDPNDTEGRTVIYQILPENKFYSGSGLSYAKDGKKLRHMVGLFKGWQSIDGSQDKYLKLFDPVNNKNLPLVRVAFEPSALFQDTVDMTALGVEEVSATKTLNNGSKSTNKPISFFSSQLDKFLKINDVVVLNFIEDDAGELKKDVNDNLLALWLIIRRNNGLADFQKEIK